MLVCEEALTDGAPEQLHSWDRIRVSLDQVSRLAVNGLPLDGQAYVMDSQFGQIADRLDRRKKPSNSSDSTLSEPSAVLPDAAPNRLYACSKSAYLLIEAYFLARTCWLRLVMQG
jgi:hypothetical protein